MNNLKKSGMENSNNSSKQSSRVVLGITSLWALLIGFKLAIKYNNTTIVSLNHKENELVISKKFYGPDGVVA